MNEHLPDFADAVAFLNRDPLANRELLLALYYEPLSQLWVVRRDAIVRSVAIRGPGPFNPNPDWVRLDAYDVAAARSLLDQIEPTEHLIVSIHRPWIGALATQHYGFHPTGMGVYGYAMNRTQLVSFTLPGIRLLQRSDASLVDRSDCGWNRSYFERLFNDGRRPWAIVQDGQIVCRASSGYGYGGSEEVVGVWTHPRRRGHGLARSLVSVVAADILERMAYATYTTTYENAASQAVARAVGFQQVFAAESYRRIA